MAAKQIDMKTIVHRFARLMNIKVTADKKKQCLVLHISGLGYGDISRTGIPQPWSVSKILETARVMAMKYPEYDIFPDDKGSFVSVVSSQYMKFTRQFYSYCAFNSHMNLVVSRGHLGNSSASVIMDLVKPDSGSLLVRNQRQIVTIDKITRKTLPLPQAYRDEFQANAKIFPLKIQVVPKPDGAHTHTYKVAHSDTDFLYHTNQSRYIRFCMDTAADAVVSGHLHYFTKDMFNYKLDSMVILHQGETFPGDIISTAVWEENNQPGTLHFQIMKAEKPVFFARAVFYMDKLNNKL